MFNPRHDLALGSGIALQLVGDQYPWAVAQTLEQFAEESFGGLPISTALRQDIENMALLIRRPPEIVELRLMRR